MTHLHSLLALATVCGLMQQSVAAHPFEFTQGVIVDAAHSIVYMTNSDSRVVAVELSSGTVVATSARVTKPIFAYRNLLLATARDQSGTLRVEGLNAKDLTPKFEFDLPIPSRAEPGSFHESARLDNREIVLQWRAIYRSQSPIPMRKSADVEMGFARIDPATWRLIATGSGEAPAAQAPQSVPVGPRDLAENGRLASRLCSVDDLVVALQYIDKDGENTVALRRWRRTNDQALPPIDLFGGRLTFRDFSRDCRHLLASAEKNNDWNWHIYSTATGKLTAEFDNALPGPEFFVFENLVIYLAPATGQSVAGRLRINPPTLIAVDVKSGQKSWARPIGEPAYVGPYPGNRPTLLPGSGRE